MRRVWLALLLMLLLPCPALGEALPADVLALCQAAYPGYEAAMFDGWDGGESGGGQYAVVMHNDDPAEGALTYEKFIDGKNGSVGYIPQDALWAGNG